MEEHKGSHDAAQAVNVEIALLHLPIVRSRPAAGSGSATGRRAGTPRRFALLLGSDRMLVVDDGREGVRLQAGAAHQGSVNLSLAKQIAGIVRLD